MDLSLVVGVLVALFLGLNCVVVPAPVQHASPNAIVHIASHQQPRSHACQKVPDHVPGLNGGTGGIR